ncbi:MAG TPA: hypothetical protein VN771_08065 [Candidatus Baltobacteraceae bacterium]|nr:hypothetical protein [Candidatus Baltobacteraceae bacterium]
MVVVAALLGLSACAAPISPSAVTPSSSAAPLASGEIALPTESPVSLPSGAIEVCGGVGISAVLRGNVADPRVAWLVDNDLGTRIDVVWPPGYRAKFTPNLEVLDENGVVLLRAGDAVTGGCVTANAPTLLLEPPFK